MSPKTLPNTLASSPASSTILPTILSKNAAFFKRFYTFTLSGGPPAEGGRATRRSVNPINLGVVDGEAAGHARAWISRQVG